ncbi:MAG: SDR family oxidoreductase [Synergistaceae bacterium]|nr:SDR family oxidoreductase [Synergistaceae bacterium]
MGIIERLNLQGKTALVTGGGQGLGRIFCHALAEAGANVCVADIRLKNAKIVAEEISANCKVETLPMYVDVTNEASVDTMFKEVENAFRFLDICVANAGVFIPGIAHEMPLADWKKTFAVDVEGVFLTARGAARLMIPRKKGSIITISSMNGHVAAYSPSCSYCAAKSAVLNFTRAVAREWGPYNIRVNSISPGSMHTEMLDHDCKGNEFFEIWTQRTALGRLGNPEELQSALIYLASDASSFTTGSDVIVDGGHTCI